MSPLQVISLALGAGFSSGLNLYATVATLGLLERFHVIHLPEKLHVLAHPIVLGFAIGLYILEFLADKVPYLDTVWDFLHTFVRPPAAAVLAFGVSAGNTVPEPFSNWALSIGEDLLAVWLTWFTTAHPILTIVLVSLLSLLCTYL